MNCNNYVQTSTMPNVTMIYEDQNNQLEQAIKEIDEALNAE